MVFYVLDLRLGIESGVASFEPVGHVERVEPPHCETCGWRLGLLKRIPPYKYRMISKHVTDIVTDRGVFAVSPRLKELFPIAGLTGLEFSQVPIKLTKSSAELYMADPAYTCTLIDTEASGAIVRKFVGCAKCGSAAYNKIDRIVIREDTWKGEDVFTLSSLKGVVLVTQRFVDFVNENNFSGFFFTHQHDFNYDYSSVGNRFDSSAVEWPAFLFGTPNCALEVLHDVKSLKTASERTLIGLSRMKELFLVDSKGVRHDLHSPRYGTEPSLAWRVRSRLVGTARPIMWQAVNRGELSAEQLKELIVNHFDEYQSMWQEIYGFENLEIGVRRAATIGEVFAAFQ